MGRETVKKQMVNILNSHCAIPKVASLTYTCMVRYALMPALLHCYTI
jgi:hypothetical protein